MTVDVHKNVPFYSPDSFFSFVPPHQKRFLWEDFFLRIFSSFVRFRDGHVLCAHMSIPKTNERRKNSEWVLPQKSLLMRGNERKKTVWRIERHIFMHVLRHKKTLLNTSPQNDERVIRGSEIE